ncbi:MAG: YraN family protein [Candidatus Roizmanbacteria bacterium]|nr:YraN family protein [Candidatus Roizmanbacteria bacterium]
MHQQNPQKNPLSQARGKQGELLARKHLQNNGYSIIESNWRGRWAEIDIIAVHADTLVIVEVKTRHSHEHGLPEESITPHKLRILERSALLYKQEHPELPDVLRIDFIGIDFTEGITPRINLIKNISS